MTIGWIKEDAEERFYESLAATGAEPWPFTGRECPFCRELFKDFPELNAHLHDQHSSRRPFLLLSGREPGPKDAVRRAVPDAEIELVATDTVWVSVDRSASRQVRTAALSQLLSAPGSRTLDIKLSNGRRGRTPQEESYRLRVRIASEEELRHADRTFVRLFGRQPPHLLAIDRLIAEAGRGVVDDYIEGLCEYVRGVLNKDQAPGTGVHGPASDWTEAYKRSLDLLVEVRRPLPRLLCGLMRFALNDFSMWRGETEFPLLDAALGTLGPLTENSNPAAGAPTAEGSGRIEVCPVDAGVHAVIDLNNRFAGLDRWSVIDEERARHLAQSEPLGPLDRAKSTAVWAATALRLGAGAAAEEPLRRLANNDCFGAWAGAQIERHFT